MKKREIFTLACLGIAAGLLFPVDLLASTTHSAFATTDVTSLADNVKNLMFHTVVPCAAGTIGGVQVVRSFMSNNFQAMGTYALLTACSFILPSFIDGIYVKSMLLP